MPITCTHKMVKKNSSTVLFRCIKETYGKEQGHTMILAVCPLCPLQTAHWPFNTHQCTAETQWR